MTPQAIARCQAAPQAHQGHSFTLPRASASASNLHVHLQLPYGPTLLPLDPTFVPSSKISLTPIPMIFSPSCSTPPPTPWLSPQPKYKEGSCSMNSAILHEPGCTPSTQRDTERLASGNTFNLLIGQFHNFLSLPLIC